MIAYLQNRNLEKLTYLGAEVEFVEEALLGVRVDSDDSQLLGHQYSLVYKVSRHRNIPYKTRILTQKM